MNVHEFELDYPNGPHIHRDLPEAALQEYLGQLELKVRDGGSGWVWYRLPTFMNEGRGIGIELGFYRGNLKEVTLFHDDPVLYGEDWDDWSEDKEQLRAETTRSWLAAKGFYTGRYSWGEIWSHYEVKSGFGAAGVRYGTR